MTDHMRKLIDLAKGAKKEVVSESKSPLTAFGRWGKDVLAEKAPAGKKAINESIESMIEDGFMTHKDDVWGLERYLKSVGIMPEKGELLRMPQFENHLESHHFAPGDPIFGYYINLDERGQFYADVRNSKGESVFEIKDDEEEPFDDIEDDEIEEDEGGAAMVGEDNGPTINVFPKDGKWCWYVQLNGSTLAHGAENTEEDATSKAHAVDMHGLGMLDESPEMHLLRPDGGSECGAPCDEDSCTAEVAAVTCPKCLDGHGEFEDKFKHEHGGDLDRMYEALEEGLETGKDGEDYLETMWGNEDEATNPADMDYHRNKALEEGWGEESPVYGAVMHRISYWMTKGQAPEFAEFSMEEIEREVRDVADRVGDVEEIGSSDISAWSNWVLDGLKRGAAAKSEVKEDEESEQDIASSRQDAQTKRIIALVRNGKVELFGANGGNVFKVPDQNIESVLGRLEATMNKPVGKVAWGQDGSQHPVRR